MPQEAYAVNNSMLIEKNAIVTEIGLDAVLFDRLTFAGSVETFEKSIGFVAGMPNFNVYSLNSKFLANWRATPDDSKVTVDVYALHECRHPVACWKDDSNTFNYATTRFGIKVSGHF